MIPQYFYIESGQTELERNKPGAAERIPSDAGTVNGIFMWGQAVYFISQLLGIINISKGARVLDSGFKGCEFETHWRHCIVSLSKTLYPLLTNGSNREERKS